MTKPSDEKEEKTGRTGRSRGKRARNRRQEARERPSVVAEWTKSIIIAALLFFVLRAFIVQTFVITSGSMENTLLVGDFLLVDRAAIGSYIPFTHVHIPGYSKPKRGDVLVFRPPPPDDTTMMLVKRLIGMPGDTIQMRNQVVYIDGKRLDEPYVKHTDSKDSSYPWMAWQKAYLEPGVDKSTYSPTRDNWGPLIIPKDRYFMMGDNRENSFDSRYWGLLPGERLEGRAEFLYFSYNKNSYKPFPWIREIRWGRIGDIIH